MILPIGEAAITAGIAAIVEEHGKLNILINNVTSPRSSVYLMRVASDDHESGIQAVIIMRKPATETTGTEFSGS